MWRTVKAVSQLVIISFAFWGGIMGALPPMVAFGGMLVVYFGLEQLESALAAVGQREAVASMQSDGGEDEREAEPDGGRPVLEQFGGNDE